MKYALRSKTPSLSSLLANRPAPKIGHQHGTAASPQIAGTIAFYTNMFSQTSQLSWPQVLEIAKDFAPTIQAKWPDYHAEMQGVADGAGVSLLDIIAINVRTEIAFGLFSDGCTALSWLTPGASWLAQNWDWMEEQKRNLILLTIRQQGGRPTIKMVTEAGLIGKIGMNDAGVGVCLNAIRMKGMDVNRVPCHLGLRMVLDSRSREEAVARLEREGVASACHMLIADATGGVGKEWSAADVQTCEVNSRGQVFHSNHYLCAHPGVGDDTKWLKDSGFRVKRIEELAEGIKGVPEFEDVKGIFRDEANYPGSICRAQKGASTSASLFNIVMDLKARRAEVVLGRLVEPEDWVELRFDGDE